MLSVDEFTCLGSDLTWALLNRDKMTDKEVEFVLDLKQQMDEYGVHMRFSVPQRNWLNRISERFGE